MKQYLKPLCSVAAIAVSLYLAPAATAQTATTKQPMPQSDRAYKQMTQEERIEKRLAKMREKLSLTDQQAADIRAILAEDAAKLKAAREQVKSADSKDAKKEARIDMRAQMETTKERIAAVLNDEQRAKLKEFREHRKERFQHRREMRRKEKN